MNKKTLSIIFFLLVAIMGGLIIFQKKVNYANINWPKSSQIEVGKDQDVIIILKEQFRTEQGNWPIQTTFQIYENKIHQIEVFTDFEFYGFQFKKGALIVAAADQVGHSYQMYIKDKLSIDGLQLHEECTLEFKNRVLFAASCPEFEKVEFKRFITPESLNIKFEGESSLDEPSN